jgi:predicted DNA-binding antitoxin AbrB/MazE fold protein
LAQGSIGESMTITAKYEDGVFKPLEDVSISEGCSSPKPIWA